MASIPQKPITCVTPGNAMLVSIEICLSLRREELKEWKLVFLLLKCNYRAMMREDG